ncbi:MAG: hypothetical protein RR277_09730, partial [Rikenellaceae bacterium]
MWRRLQIIGTRAVTHNSIASLIHQIAISETTATMRHADIDIASGAGDNSSATKTAMPKMSPIFFC